MKNDLNNFDDEFRSEAQDGSNQGNLYDEESMQGYSNLGYSDLNQSEVDENNQDEDKPKEVEKHKWLKTWVIVALTGFIVILIIVILILLLRGPVVIYRDRIVQDDPAHADILWETSAEEGGLETRDPEEIKEELNRKVEEGMINIQMNTTVSFTDGESEGNLGIVNSEINNWPQVVQIVRKDTEEEIFKSGAIPVGHKLETGKLSVDLPAGEYECVAYFSNVDVERGIYMGTAGAEIIVKVLG